MNSIQMISHKLQTRRLKLAMGLNPRADIDSSMVRSMWQEMKHESLKAQLGSRFTANGAANSSYPAQEPDEETPGSNQD